MSKDPFNGQDPLGVDPVEHVIKVSDSKLDRSIKAYKQNILLRGTHVIDSTQPVAPPRGDDGKELTYERRCELASQRKPFQPLADESVDLGYGEDLKEHEVEELGATAQKIIDQQPDMTIVTPKILDTPKESDEYPNAN